MKGFMGMKRLMCAMAGAVFVFAAASAASAAGSGDGAWEEAFGRAYAAALADAPFEPSSLALAIVEAEAGALRGDRPPEDAARRVLELSLCAERALRFGTSPQDARALVRARLRFDGPGLSASRFSKELGKSLKASASGGAAGSAASGGLGGFGGRGRR